MKEAINKFYIKNEAAFEIEGFDDKYLKEGKSLYEVIKVIDRVPLFLEAHLDRVFNSSKLVNLSINYSKEKIKEVILKLIEVNDTDIGNVKLVFNFNEEEKTFLAYFIRHSYPSEDDYKTGVDAISYKAERENPNAKVINYDFKKKVEEKIKEAKVYEAILVNNEGFITEGSRSNMFFVKNNIVYTSPVDTVLPGITRSMILSLCERLNIKVVEKLTEAEKLNEIEGLFLSGTSPNALPIRSVGALKFNSSENKIIKQIVDGFNQLINEDIQNNKK